MTMLFLYLSHYYTSNQIASAFGVAAFFDTTKAPLNTLKQDACSTFWVEEWQGSKFVVAMVASATMFSHLLPGCSCGSKHLLLP